MDFEVKNTFSARLAEAIGQRSISEVARASGIVEGTIRKYVRGETEPNLRNLVALSESLHVTCDWLAGISQTKEKRFYVPYLEWEYFAEAQVEIHHPRAIAAQEINFSRKWVSLHTGCDPDSLRSLYMEGDSMGQTIRNGNFMLVEMLGKEGVPQNGIYVVQMAEAGISVLRVQIQPRNTIQILFDNPTYKSFDLKINEVQMGPGKPGGIRILARVVWLGHRV